MTKKLIFKNFFKILLSLSFFSISITFSASLIFLNSAFIASQYCFIYSFMN